MYACVCVCARSRTYSYYTIHVHIPAQINFEETRTARKLLGKNAHAAQCERNKNQLEHVYKNAQMYIYIYQERARARCVWFCARNNCTPLRAHAVTHTHTPKSGTGKKTQPAICVLMHTTARVRHMPSGITARAQKTHM